MTTIRDLAREFNAQPYEIAAFADLNRGYDETAELDTDTETMIREAWAAAPDYASTAEQNRRETAVLDELAHIVDRAGYDY